MGSTPWPARVACLKHWTPLWLSSPPCLICSLPGDTSHTFQRASLHLNPDSGSASWIVQTQTAPLTVQHFPPSPTDGTRTETRSLQGEPWLVEQLHGGMGWGRIQNLNEPFIPPIPQQPLFFVNVSPIFYLNECSWTDCALEPLEDTQQNVPKNAIIFTQNCQCKFNFLWPAWDSHTTACWGCFPEGPRMSSRDWWCCE